MGGESAGLDARGRAAGGDPDGRACRARARRPPSGKLAKLLKEEMRKKLLVVSADVYRPAAIEQLAHARGGRSASTSSRRRSAQKPVDIARAAVDARAHALPRRADRRHGRAARDRRGDDEGDRRAARGARPRSRRCSSSTRCRARTRSTSRRPSTRRCRSPASCSPSSTATRAAARRSRCATSPASRSSSPASARSSTASSRSTPSAWPRASSAWATSSRWSRRRERAIDQDEAQKLAEKFKKGKGFDLEDFKAQIQQMKKMGGVASLVDKLPAQFAQAAAERAAAAGRPRCGGSRASSTR